MERCGDPLKSDWRFRPAMKEQERLAVRWAAIQICDLQYIRTNRLHIVPLDAQSQVDNVWDVYRQELPSASKRDSASREGTMLHVVALLSLFLAILSSTVISIDDGSQSTTNVDHECRLA